MLVISPIFGLISVRSCIEIVESVSPVFPVSPVSRSESSSFWSLFILYTGFQKTEIQGLLFVVSKSHKRYLWRLTVKINEVFFLATSNFILCWMKLFHTAKEYPNFFFWKARISPNYLKIFPDFPEFLWTVQKCAFSVRIWSLPINAPI